MVFVKNPSLHVSFDTDEEDEETEEVESVGDCDWLSDGSSLVSEWRTDTIPVAIEWTSILCTKIRSPAPFTECAQERLIDITLEWITILVLESDAIAGVWICIGEDTAPSCSDSNRVYRISETDSLLEGDEWVDTDIGTSVSDENYGWLPCCTWEGLIREEECITDSSTRESWEWLADVGCIDVFDYRRYTPSILTPWHREKGLPRKYDESESVIFAFGDKCFDSILGGFDTTRWDVLCEHGAWDVEDEEDIVCGSFFYLSCDSICRCDDEEHDRRDDGGSYHPEDIYTEWDSSMLSHERIGELVSDTFTQKYPPYTEDDERYYHDDEVWIHDASGGMLLCVHCIRSSLL